MKTIHAPIRVEDLDGRFGWVHDSDCCDALVQYDTGEIEVTNRDHLWLVPPSVSS